MGYVFQVENSVLVWEATCGNVMTSDGYYNETKKQTPNNKQFIKVMLLTSILQNYITTSTRIKEVNSQ